MALHSNDDLYKKKSSEDDLLLQCIGHDLHNYWSFEWPSEMATISDSIVNFLTTPDDAPWNAAALEQLLLDQPNPRYQTIALVCAIIHHKNAIDVFLDWIQEHLSSIDQLASAALLARNTPLFDAIAERFLCKDDGSGTPTRLPHAFHAACTYNIEAVSHVLPWFNWHSIAKWIQTSEESASDSSELLNPFKAAIAFDNEQILTTLLIELKVSVKCFTDLYEKSIRKAVLFALLCNKTCHATQLLAHYENHTELFIIETNHHETISEHDVYDIFMRIGSDKNDRAFKLLLLLSDASTVIKNLLDDGLELLLMGAMGSVDEPNFDRINQLFQLNFAQINHMLYEYNDAIEHGGYSNPFYFAFKKAAINNDTTMLQRLIEESSNQIIQQVSHVIESVIEDHRPELNETHKSIFTTLVDNNRLNKKNCLLQSLGLDLLTWLQKNRDDASFYDDFPIQLIRWIKEENTQLEVSQFKPILHRMNPLYQLAALITALHSLDPDERLLSGCSEFGFPEQDLIQAIRLVKGESGLVKHIDQLCNHDETLSQVLYSVLTSPNLAINEETLNNAFKRIGEQGLVSIFNLLKTLASSELNDSTAAFINQRTFNQQLNRLLTGAVSHGHVHLVEHIINYCPPSEYERMLAGEDTACQPLYEAIKTGHKKLFEKLAVMMPNSLKVNLLSYGLADKTRFNLINILLEASPDNINVSFRNNFIKYLIHFSERYAKKYPIKDADQTRIKALLLDQLNHQLSQPETASCNPELLQRQTDFQYTLLLQSIRLKDVTTEHQGPSLLLNIPAIQKKARDRCDLEQGKTLLHLMSSCNQSVLLEHMIKYQTRLFIDLWVADDNGRFPDMLAQNKDIQWLHTLLNPEIAACTQRLLNAPLSANKPTDAQLLIALSNVWISWLEGLLLTQSHDSASLLNNIIQHQLNFPEKLRAPIARFSVMLQFITEFDDTEILTRTRLQQFYEWAQNSHPVPARRSIYFFQPQPSNLFLLAIHQLLCYLKSDVELLDEMALDYLRFVLKKYSNPQYTTNVQLLRNKLLSFNQLQPANHPITDSVSFDDLMKHAFYKEFQPYITIIYQQNTTAEQSIDDVTDFIFETHKQQRCAVDEIYAPDGCITKTGITTYLANVLGLTDQTLQQGVFNLDTANKKCRVE